jgi:hypothetical protein
MSDSLVLPFSELYNAVSKFLGSYGSSGPSGTDLTDAKAIVNTAYRRLLLYHNWTFLTSIRQIVTVGGTWQYELPLDFVRLKGTFRYSSTDSYPPLRERMWEQIEGYRAVSDTSGYPDYFAIQAGEHTSETGQKWIVGLFPTPDAAYTLYYNAEIWPSKLVNDSDLHIGGPDTSEVLKQLALAQAETEQDEISGVQENKAKEMVAAAIMKDNQRRAHNLGYNDDTNMVGYPDIAREYRLNEVNMVDF